LPLVDGAFEIKKTEVDAKISIKNPRNCNLSSTRRKNQLKEMVEAIKEMRGQPGNSARRGSTILVQHFMAKAEYTLSGG